MTLDSTMTRSRWNAVLWHCRYFQGGSAEWGLRKKEEVCPNLVPTEIALKVAAKIRARQQFAAYIVVPFWCV